MSSIRSRIAMASRLRTKFFVPASRGPILDVRMKLLHEFRRSGVTLSFFPVTVKSGVFQNRLIFRKRKLMVVQVIFQDLFERCGFPDVGNAFKKSFTELVVQSHCLEHWLLR